MLDCSCQDLNLYAGVKSIITKQISDWFPDRATHFHVILDGMLLLRGRFNPFSCWDTLAALPLPLTTATCGSVRSLQKVSVSMRPHNKDIYLICP